MYSRKNCDADIELDDVISKPLNNDKSKQEFGPNSTKKCDTLFFYFSVITVNTMMFVNGACMIWTSPVIPQLISNNPEINPLGGNITMFQISLLVGLPSLFTILSPLFLGKLPDIIGRKNTLVCISLGTLLSYIAVAFGRHIYIYYIGRSIANFCMGLIYVALPIYLNEICEDHNRARHGCLMMFFIPFGSLYGYLIGPVTNFKVFTLLCVAPLILHLIFLCLFVPESPFYTASKGYRGTTITILKKLRSNKNEQEIEADYNQIEAAVKSRHEAQVRGLKNIFETKALRKGFIIGLGSCLSTNMSGVSVIMGFLGPIFNDAGTNLSGNLVAILVGCVKLLFFFVTINVVGRFGRRPLLLFSTIGTGIPLTILAVYFYLNGINSQMVASVRWLPVVCILVYISNYSMGLGSIPFSSLSELFPNDLKSIATSLVITIANVFQLISITTFPIVSDLVGVHYCIGIFSLCCFLGFTFTYYFLPETRGKSFLEIQEILNR